MVSVRLRHLHKDRDRHGNIRYYVVRKGLAKIRIRGEYGSADFLENYKNALQDKISSIKVQNVPDGSFEWLCRKYFSSTEFNSSIRKSTQDNRRRILVNLCKSIGQLPAHLLEKRHILDWLDARGDKPGAGNNLLKTLKALYSFGVTRDLVAKNPTSDIRKIRYANKKIHTWSRQEIAAFEAKYPVGTKARLALSILLFTGLRRGDAVRIGRQHLREGVLTVPTSKTGVTIAIPVIKPLQRVLENSPVGDLNFLVTEFGKPFTANGFGNAFKKWCVDAGLSHCTAHGLRSAGATFAAESGANPHELMAIYGWKNLQMAAHYTQNADRKILSETGMQKLAAGTRGEQNSPTDTSQWENSIKSSKENSR